MSITHVQQSAEQRYLVGTTARILAEIAILGSVVSLLGSHTELAIPSVEDHTPPAVIAAKICAMVIRPVLFAQNPAKSAAITRNAVNYVMSLAHHVLRIVPGLAHIVDGVGYHVQCLVIYYHAQSAVDSF